MQDLTGKTALVTGIANRRSIAYAIGEELGSRGVKLALTYQPLGREGETGKFLKATESLGAELRLPMDAADSASVTEAFGAMKKKWGRLDILVHAMATAKREELEGRHSDISREGFLLAQDVSAYSLIELVRASRPLMAEGGSVIALTYIGSQRVVNNYNVMGSAKAALEANVRYLAMELGPENIRVNAISAGPVRTLSASGITDFLDLLHNAATYSALKRNITPQEIANTACFLASSLSSGITGQILYVDGGFNIFA